jgi:F-type H+-transporting ATPase subunit gamma
MATLKDIKLKIAGVKKTQQITRAMNMVASAKLRGAQERMERFRPYAQKFNEVLADVSARIEPDIHPLLTAVPAVRTVDLIVLTADRGLCGSFNTNLLSAAEKFVAAKKAAGIATNIYAIGRRGRDYLRRRGYDIFETLVGQMGQVDMELAGAVGQQETDRFIAGEADEVYLLYSRFANMGSQVPTIAPLLPISPPAAEEAVGEAGEGAMAVEYLLEPSAEEIIFELLPRSVNVKIYHGLLETNTSEQAARMTAMDNATKACKDMIADLTLAYNKARQAAITTELMDIVGGAEALAKAS